MSDRLAEEIVGGLVTAALLLLLRSFGVDVYNQSWRPIRLIMTLWTRIIRRRRYVLVYTDVPDNRGTTLALEAALKKQLAAEQTPRGNGNSRSHRGHTFKAVPTGEMLLQWPIASLRWAFGAVLVLVTDVTPLSLDARRREAIERRLRKFVHRGGVLILGHDAIYRRARNDILQELAGCQLTQFVSTTKQVPYKLNTLGSRRSRDEALLNVLPDELELTDGEIVGGLWAADVQFVYVHGQRGERWPLVTRRDVGRGVVYWLNSGDHSSSGPPRSIAMPEDGFMALLRGLLGLGQQGTNS